MKLSVVDTEKIVVHDVKWVELHTPVGSMVIQDKHAPIIIELSAHQLLSFELVDGEQISMMITQAVAHVTRSEVKILVPLVA